MNTLNPQFRRASRLVEVGERTNVLPRHFGRMMLMVENSVYFWAGRLSKDYRGSFWHFYEFGESGFYMAPDEESFHVQVDGNGFEGTVSADAFGIICCLFAFSHLSSQMKDDNLIKHLELLQGYASEHADVSLIIAAID